MMNTDFYHEILNNCFIRILLSHITRWCLAHRRDYLTWCNTNDNGTERLNEDSKYECLQKLLFYFLRNQLKAIADILLDKNAESNK